MPAVLTDGHLADPLPQDLGRTLLRSVLALVQLRRAIVTDQPVLDTAGSRTLGMFEADFYESTANVQALLERVRQMLDLSEAEGQGPGL